MQTVPARNEIAIEHTWNAESVFPTAADWQAEFMRIAAQLPDLERFQGRLGDGPAVLLGRLSHALDGLEKLLLAPGPQAVDAAQIILIADVR